MDFFERFMDKHLRKNGTNPEDGRDPVRLKQFNTTISPDLISGVKVLAATYGVPRWVIAEHALQIGFFHLIKSGADSKKEELVRNHLLENHLLSKMFMPDSQGIIRLNETVYPARLLAYKKRVVRLAEAYQDVAEWLLDGGNTKLAKQSINQMRPQWTRLSKIVLLLLSQMEKGSDESDESRSESKEKSPEEPE